MWVLLVIFMNGNGMTSQQILVPSEAYCKQKQVEIVQNASISKKVTVDTYCIYSGRH